MYGFEELESGPDYFTYRRGRVVVYGNKDRGHWTVFVERPSDFETVTDVLAAADSKTEALDIAESYMQGHAVGVEER